MAPLDPRYTQVGFNLTSVQVWWVFEDQINDKYECLLPLWTPKLLLLFFPFWFLFLLLIWGGNRFASEKTLSTLPGLGASSTLLLWQLISWEVFVDFHSFLLQHPFLLPYWTNNKEKVTPFVKRRMCPDHCLISVWSDYLATPSTGINPPFRTVWNFSETSYFWGGMYLYWVPMGYVQRDNPNHTGGNIFLSYVLDASWWRQR